MYKLDPPSKMKNKHPLNTLCAYTVYVATYIDSSISNIFLAKALKIHPSLKILGLF